MKSQWTLIPVAIALVATGCARQTDFLHPEKHTCPVPEKLEPQRIVESVVVPNEVHMVYEVALNDKVDILWVIDNSASMANHRASVAANMTAFTDALGRRTSLTGRAVDSKLGILSTDPTELPYHGFAVNNAATGSQLSLAMNLIGQESTGIEGPYDAILSALKNDPSFLRADANLAVIIVTDEDEQSMENDTESFLAELKRLKPLDGSLHVYGILGGAPFGCDGAAFDEGDPFVSLFERTGGTTLPICSTDFGAKLADLGADLVKNVMLRRNLVLDSRPDALTIQVIYDGRVIPGGSAEQGGQWQYDIDRNTVVFHNQNLGTGSKETIRIVYKEKRDE